MIKARNNSSFKAFGIMPSLIKNKLLKVIPRGRQLLGKANFLFQAKNQKQFLIATTKMTYLIDSFNLCNHIPSVYQILFHNRTIEHYLEPNDEIQRRHSFLKIRQFDNVYNLSDAVSHKNHFLNFQFELIRESFLLKQKYELTICSKIIIENQKEWKGIPSEKYPEFQDSLKALQKIALLRVWRLFIQYSIHIHSEQGPKYLRMFHQQVRKPSKGLKEKG